MELKLREIMKFEVWIMNWLGALFFNHSLFIVHCSLFLHLYGIETWGNYEVWSTKYELIGGSVLQLFIVHYTLFINFAPMWNWNFGELWSLKYELWTVYGLLFLIIHCSLYIVHYFCTYMELKLRGNYEVWSMNYELFLGLVFNYSLFIIHCSLFSHLCGIETSGELWSLKYELWTVSGLCF